MGEVKEYIRAMFRWAGVGVGVAAICLGAGQCNKLRLEGEANKIRAEGEAVKMRAEADEIRARIQNQGYKSPVSPASGSLEYRSLGN